MKQNIMRFIRLLMVTIFFTACSSPNGNTQGGSTKTGTGICANPYYPVIQGATWNYRSTGGPDNRFDFADTLTSVHNDGFAVTSQFENLTVTQEWSCTQDGLSILQLGGPAVATLRSQEIDLNLDVTNVEGVTYPKVIEPGMVWQQTMEFGGEMNFGGQDATAEGNAQTTFTALGRESVRVPAGTFDAMKVDATTTINVSVTVQGLRLPVIFSSSSTLWLVEGVGWVKLSSEINSVGKDFSETIELRSYNIP